MYDFSSNATQDTRDFFGYNNGLPMHKPDQSGMLEGGENIFLYNCHDVNRTVPYFETLDTDYESINEYLYKVYEDLGEQDIDLGLRD